MAPFIGCPWGGAIMDHFGPHFARVDIVLHPFLKPQTLPLSRFTPASFPSDAEILADCRPVPWAEILRGSDFDSLSQIDIALRSYIHGLRDPDTRLRDRLVQMLDREGLIPPEEGEITPHLRQAFLRAMQAAGHRELMIWDEFGFEHKLMPVNDMLGRSVVPPHGSIATPDGSALLTTHWDSCCSFLCRNDAAEIAGLETFPCTARTQVYWGLHPI